VADWPAGELWGWGVGGAPAGVAWAFLATPLVWRNSHQADLILIQGLEDPLLVPGLGNPLLVPVSLKGGGKPDPDPEPMAPRKPDPEPAGFSAEEAAALTDYFQQSADKV
jgi:hypothetical protein